MTAEPSLAQAFLDQNKLAAATLTIEDVEPYAEHHSGGLIVLGQPLDKARYVKMHDSWGDEGTVVVHAYDTLEDGHDSVEHFKTGAEALARFLSVPANLPTLTAGEVIAALQRFPTGKPVLIYDEAASWYRNIRVIEAHDEDHAIVIGAADTYDTRQW